MIYNTIEPQEILRLFTPMKTATFYIDKEYKDSVEDLGFKLKTSARTLSK